MEKIGDAEEMLKSKKTSWALAQLFRPFIEQNRSWRASMLRAGRRDGRYTPEASAGPPRAAATLHTRTDETSNRAPRREGEASLARSDEQLTAAAEPHSRAPLSAMSFILHQLISFQTYNSERRLDGGSVVGESCESGGAAEAGKAAASPKTRSPR